MRSRAYSTLIMYSMYINFLTQIVAEKVNSASLL